MVNYILKARGKEYPLSVVNNHSWGGGMQIIAYESPGTNGGIVLTTGRTTNEITLNGRLLMKPNESFADLVARKDELDNIKNRGEPVILSSPVGNNDTGVYLITSFTGILEGGMATSLPFTMKLTEYRQSNLKRTKVNLISFEPAEEFKKILAERTFGR